MILLRVIIIFFIFLILNHIISEKTIIEGNVSYTAPEEREAGDEQGVGDVEVDPVDDTELQNLKEKYDKLNNKYNEFRRRFDEKTEELELILKRCLKQKEE